MRHVPYWIDTGPIGRFKRLQKNENVDVVVVGVGISNVRKAGAWAAEKAGRARLIIAGDEPGCVGLVLTLQGLIMGVTGKKLMWRALAAGNLPQLSRYDFKELERRAEQQIERIEIERIRAAQQAFEEMAGPQ
jgi:thioredoxin reductase